MVRMRAFKTLKVLMSTILSISAFGVHNYATAAETEYVNYQQILQEERAWAGLRSKTLRVGDVVWSYSEGGNPNAPTVLLLHGLASDRDSWNRIAHDLTPSYHVIIPDLPSSGRTQIPSNLDLSINNVTEQLRRFLEATRSTNNLNIAGHSLGGSVALFYASKYPDDTRSLLLMSIGGPFTSSNTTYLSNPVYLKQLIVAQPGDLDFVNRKVMVNPPFIPSIIKKEQEKSFIKDSQETAKVIEELSNINKYYNRAAFTKMLHEIKSPTLIIWGKQDQIVNVEIANELKGMLKNAEAPVLLNHVGHVPILEADQLVIQNYLPFLKKVNNPQPQQ
ncbi:alpha/beta fold hydrolase [Acinetobacter gerneri]|uniref:alpha/beta fold hydrolase n=1 Tax=Acinetobacter gerneri TaxID=202952 RepID=UPI0028AB7F1B|nr:alpha/beta hydrolase [Acinetobacter gerneri]